MDTFGDAWSDEASASVRSDPGRDRRPLLLRGDLPSSGGSADARASGDGGGLAVAVAVVAGGVADEPPGRSCTSRN